MEKDTPIKHVEVFEKFDEALKLAEDNDVISIVFVIELVDNKRVYRATTNLDEDEPATKDFILETLAAYILKLADVYGFDPIKTTRQVLIKEATKKNKFEKEKK